MKKGSANNPIRDLLVKLEKYYKDIYIIHGSCFCEGELSSSENPGYYFGVFTENSIEAVRNEWDNEPLVFIENIRSAKDNLKEFSQIIKNDSEIAEIEKKFNVLYEKVRKSDKWLIVPLSDEDIDKMFSRRECIELKFEGTAEHVVMSKSCFPGITPKRVKDIEYTVLNEKDEFIEVIFRYNFEYFTIYLSYAILRNKIKK